MEKRVTWLQVNKETKYINFGVLVNETELAYFDINFISNHYFAGVAVVDPDGCLTAKAIVDDSCKIEVWYEDVRIEINVIGYDTNNDYYELCIEVN